MPLPGSANLAPQVDPELLVEMAPFLAEPTEEPAAGFGAHPLGLNGWLQIDFSRLGMAWVVRRAYPHELVLHAYARTRCVPQYSMSNHIHVTLYR